MNLSNLIKWLLLSCFWIESVLLSVKNDFDNKLILKSKKFKRNNSDFSINTCLQYLNSDTMQYIAPLFQSTDHFKPIQESILNLAYVIKSGRRVGILPGLMVLSSICGVLNRSEIEKLTSYRLTSALMTTAIICADYRIQKMTKSNIKDCHERCAMKLGKLCGKNGGIYIKAAQHLSSMDHLLPNVYIKELTKLQDQAPVSPFEEIERVFKKDLGVKIDEVFSDICKEPIGSASIGQVHVATLKKTGEKVAIKVQHPNMKRDSEIDLKAFGFAFKLIKMIFPDMNLQWISEELEECLKSEMDFLNEAENSKRAKRSIELNPRLKDLVVIPKVYDELCSKRILTMEFVSGFKVNDLEGIKDAKMDLNEVNRLMYLTFMEMIFKHRFVHCDPHPGNILIFKDGQSKKVKLVLLDHGLYKEIPKDISIKFSKLLIAILGGKDDEIGKCSLEMNISPEFLDDFIKLVQTFTKNNRGAAVVNMRSEVMKFFSNQTEESKRIASDSLQKIPREMLFIIKILDLLRSNERNLVDSKRDTKIGIYFVPQSLMIISGYCMGAIDEGDPPNSLIILLKLFKLI